MKYTDLIFDLYGTLVDIHTDETMAVWEKTALYFGYHGAHYTSRELSQEYHAMLAAQEHQAGQSYEMYPDIPFDEILANLFLAKGVTDQADALALNAAHVFRIASTAYIRLYDGVPEALTRLRQRGFRLWLLSNAQRAFTAYELAHLDLRAYFDGVYLSSDYRCRKPDKRFYEALLQEQRLEPHRCLMIGNDRSTDIAGAKACGMSTLYMHTNLTPAEQKEARAELMPGKSFRRRHFEFEGADWKILCDLLEQYAATPK